MKDLTNKENKENKKDEKFQVNEAFVKEIDFLQKTIGNNEVKNLIQNQILATPATELNMGEISHRKRRIEERNEEQILIDRSALKGEIDKRVNDLEEQAADLKRKYPDRHVYVNVSIELVYVKFEDQDTNDIYHLTRLANVELSNENIIKNGDAKEVDRGKVIPKTFSFRYDFRDKIDFSNIEENAEVQEASEKTEDVEGTENFDEAENTFEEDLKKNATIIADKDKRGRYNL